MTAEIAIMNRSAIALAADSAITVESPFGGEKDRSKIYYSSNKLFTLSKYHPVGIMVFGNAELLIFPWETLIKIYRKGLGTKTFASLREYGDDFIRFLTKNNIFSKEVQQAYYEGSVHGYLMLLRSQIDDEVKSWVEANRQISEEEVKQILNASIKKHLDQWDALDFLKDNSERTANTITKLYRHSFSRILEVALARLPLNEKNRADLTRLSALLFTKSRFPSNTSGVVIAGFGDQDVFPSIAVYNIEGVINDRPKYRLEDLESITAENQAVIYPFAQKEMVQTFINGVAPEVESYLKDYIKEILRLYPEKITPVIPSIPDEQRVELSKKMKDAGDLLMKELDEQFKKFIRANYVKPTLDVVQSLPKNELAEMAEALVSLTSIKRKISLDEETVGGPIDVALISKGDGFIWMKRKHYFKPELNQHFIKNYFNK